MKQKTVNAGDDEVTQAGPTIPKINFVWPNLGEVFAEIKKTSEKSNKMQESIKRSERT